MSTVTSIEPPQANIIRGRFRVRLARLFHELQAICGSQTDRPTLHTEFLKRTVRGLNAQAGAIWRVTPDGPELVHQFNLQEVGLVQFSDPQLLKRHQELLRAAALRGGICSLEPGEELDEGPHKNPLDCVVYFAAIPAGSEAILYELCLANQEHAEVRFAALEFLQRAITLFTQHDLHAALGSLKEREQLWAQLDRFCMQVHGSIDLKETAYAIANEARNLLTADRCSVVARRGRQYQTMAVSGVETVDPRSPTSLALAWLAELVCITGEPLVFDGNMAELPPQLEAALEQFCDESGARSVAIFPVLKAAQVASLGAAPTQAVAEPIGALVVETFGEPHALQSMLACVDILQRHMQIALTHASSCAAIPAFAWQRQLFHSSLWKACVSKSRWQLALGAAVLLLAVGMIPVSWRLPATGVLKPTTAKVFAPLAGTIIDLAVEHGMEVKAGQVLARLRNDKLTAEVAYLRGELTTKQDLLASKKRKRADKEDTTPGDIVAEVQQLAAEVGYLKNALAIREQEIAAQTLTAPADGRILSWDLQAHLAGRPVERGQLLFEIAQQPENWQLQLEIPERYAGAVTTAARRTDAPLAATFVTGHDSTRRYHADLHTLALRTDLDAEGKRVLAAKATLPEVPANASADQTVHAYIACGTRPWAYTVLYDVLDFGRRLWFRGAG